MVFIIVLAGALATVFFLRLAVLKGLWILHMKIEGFRLFWQDWAPLYAWSILSIAVGWGTVWYLIR